MTDVFDRAQEREEEMRQDALADQRRRAAGRYPGASALRCAMCDEPIPEGRRVAMPGVQTCVECKTGIEKSGRWDWGMSE